MTAASHDHHPPAPPPGGAATPAPTPPPPPGGPAGGGWAPAAPPPPGLRHPTPPQPNPAALIPWLARKADLFDRIATATADPGLADDARAVAAAARHALAALVAPAVPADVAAPGGAA